MAATTTANGLRWPIGRMMNVSIDGAEARRR